MAESGGRVIFLVGGSLQQGGIGDTEQREEASRGRDTSGARLTTCQVRWIDSTCSLGECYTHELLCRDSLIDVRANLRVYVLQLWKIWDILYLGCIFLYITRYILYLLCTFNFFTKSPQYMYMLHD